MDICCAHKVHNKYASWTAGNVFPTSQPLAFFTAFDSSRCVFNEIEQVRNEICPRIKTLMEMNLLLQDLYINIGGL